MVGEETISTEMLFLSICLLKAFSAMHFFWWMFTWAMSIIILCFSRGHIHIFNLDLQCFNYTPSSSWLISQATINYLQINIEPYLWVLIPAKWMTSCDALISFHQEYILSLLRSYTASAIISWMLPKHNTMWNYPKTTPSIIFPNPLDIGNCPHGYGRGVWKWKWVSKICSLSHGKYVWL